MKLELPIKFYLTTRTHFWIFFSGALLTGGTYFIKNYCPLLSILFSILIIFFAVLYLLAHNRPIITIDGDCLVFLAILKPNWQNVIYFKDIIGLDFYLHSRDYYWDLYIKFNNGDTQSFSFHELKYNHEEVYGEQIFDLIEQVYQGNSNPTIRNAPEYDSLYGIILLAVLILFFIFLVLDNLSII